MEKLGHKFSEKPESYCAPLLEVQSAASADPQRHRRKLDSVLNHRTSQTPQGKGLL
jgi:hypothetical protein